MNAGSKPVHAMHAVLDGGGERGAFTAGCLGALLQRRPIAFDTITCTSAGFPVALCYVTAQHRAAQDGRDVADHFDEISDKFWSTLCERSEIIKGLQYFLGGDRTVTMQEMMALNAWQIGSVAEGGFALNNKWLSALGVPLPSFNPLSRLIREVIPEVDRALRDTDTATVICNRTHLYTGEEQMLNGKRASLDDMIATCALPPFLTAVDGVWIDGAFSGRNGPIRDIPDDNLPILRINLGRPYYEAYAKQFSGVPFLGVRAERAAAAAPESLPQDRLHMELHFDENGKQPDKAELPARTTVALYMQAGRDKATAITDRDLNRLMKKARPEMPVPRSIMLRKRLAQ